MGHFANPVWLDGFIGGFGVTFCAYTVVLVILLDFLWGFPGVINPVILIRRTNGPIPLV